jgi:hypothetical protein
MSDARIQKNQPSVDPQKLIEAVQAGDTSSVASLLEAGADPNATSYKGKTPLMRAASLGYVEVARVLLDAGADVNIRKENGATALTLAVFFGHTNLVGLLLARGADPSVPTQQGVPLENWARAAGFAEIAVLLSVAREASTNGPLFPSAGQFHAVVPLAELEGNAQAETPVVEDHLISQADVDEQEEPTLATRRRRGTTQSHPAVATRGRRALWSWPLIATSLAVLLVVGTILDLRWRASRIEAIAPATAEAVAGSASQESGPQIVQSNPEDSATQSAAPSASMEEAPPTLADENRAAAESNDERVAELGGGDDSEAKPEMKDRVEREGQAAAARLPARSTSDSESISASQTALSTRAPKRVTARESPALPTPSRPKAAATMSEPARRDERAIQRPRNAQRQRTPSRSREQAPQVSLPPPSVRSEKVIQWP